MQFGIAFFWDWVKASRMPWVATTYPADGQPQTHKHTAFFDRLDGVWLDMTMTCGALGGILGGIQFGGTGVYFERTYDLLAMPHDALARRRHRPTALDLLRVR